MVPLLPNERVALVGTYLYAEGRECHLKIVFSSVRLGTGDPEDPPEVADDVEVPTYYLWWGSTTDPGDFNAGGGAFGSLEDAIAAAESAPGVGPSVKWHARSAGAVP